MNKQVVFFPVILGIEGPCTNSAFECPRSQMNVNEVFLAIALCGEHFATLSA